jgi:hypothetical protein
VPRGRVSGSAGRGWVRSYTSSCESSPEQLEGGTWSSRRYSHRSWQSILRLLRRIRYRLTPTRWR